jgi:DtxR family Mn-dependent transcriptional regulator
VPATPDPSLNEYLEAILELEEEGARVIQARLADRLGLSAPSVSGMVRRLKDEAYLEVDDHRTLTLTQKGRDWATTIVRRPGWPSVFSPTSSGCPGTRPTSRRPAGST